jgi:phage gp16-like protein
MDQQRRVREAATLTLKKKEIIKKKHAQNDDGKPAIQIQNDADKNLQCCIKLSIGCHTHTHTHTHTFFSSKAYHTHTHTHTHTRTHARSHLR